MPKEHLSEYLEVMRKLREEGSFKKEYKTSLLDDASDALFKFQKRILSKICNERIEPHYNNIQTYSFYSDLVRTRVINIAKTNPSFLNPISNNTLESQLDLMGYLTNYYDNLAKVEPSFIYNLALKSFSLFDGFLFKDEKGEFKFLFNREKPSGNARKRFADRLEEIETILTENSSCLEDIVSKLEANNFRDYLSLRLDTHVTPSKLPLIKECDLSTLAKFAYSNLNDKCVNKKVFFLDPVSRFYSVAVKNVLEKIKTRRDCNEAEWKEIALEYISTLRNTLLYHSDNDDELFSMLLDNDSRAVSSQAEAF